MLRSPMVSTAPHRRVPSRLLIGVAAVGIALTTQACGADEAAEWLDEDVPRPRAFAPDVVSTAMREYGITFSPDGREAYFTRRGRRGPAQIFVTRYRDGTWTDPSPVPFAGDHDESPSISPDGQTMLFASRRLMPGSGDRSDNLWVVRRNGVEWGRPSPLPGNVNQPHSEADDFVTGAEIGPTLLADLSILYWSRIDPDWGADIVRSELQPDGRYGPPVPLRINSTGDEMNAVMSPDGQFIVFQAYRDATAPGGQDLYVSRRNELGWGAPVLLPEPFNSPANDGYPSFSPDGRFFFFATDRDMQGGFYDIWYVEATALRLAELTRRP
mgnify:FL=1